MIVSSILFLISFASADVVIGQSPAEQIPLVELYSSEGCSSCPPADAWFSALKEKKGLWQDFVPVVFHVDYWNRLGWKDPYSSPEMTKRQHEVVKAWSHPAVYTPGVMVNGREWRRWRLSSKPPEEKVKSSVQLTLSRKSAEDLKFSVVIKQTSKAERLVVRTALLGMGLSSEVSRGENSGRNLQHDFVVLDLNTETIDADSLTDIEVKLKKTGHNAKRLAVAVWVERPGKVAPIQATGGYL